MVLIFSKSNTAQTPYQLFFQDSMVLYNGVDATGVNFLSQYQKSPYKAAAFDSVNNNAGLTYYYPFKTPNDTSAWLYAGDCIDLSGNSWLGKYFFHDSLNHYSFINHYNESINIHSQENVGHQWLFYTYRDSSYLMAHISNVSMFNSGSISDSVKTIQLNFFDSLGNPGINDWSQKELLVSRNFGIIKSPHFNSFPNDTSLWTRQFNLKIASTNEIYDFNVGDKFYFEQGKMNNQPDYLYTQDYTLLEVLSKNVDTSNQITSYVFKNLYYDYKVVFPNPVYLDTIFESTLNFSFAMNESMGIPEKLAFDSLYGILFNLMESNHSNNTLNISEPVYVKNTRIYLPNSPTCFGTEITILPIKTIYAKSLGEIYKEVHIYEGAGTGPYQSYFKLLGYVKNGIVYGNFLGLHDSNKINNDLFSVISLVTDNLTIYWNSNQSGSINLYDNLGKIIHQNQVSKGFNQISLSNYSTGMYIVKGNNAEQNKSIKIIKTSP
jgi:hypothetical protein